MSGPQIVQGGPPAPTEEQMALSDASYQQVDLSFDENGKLVSPTHNLDLINRLAGAIGALPSNLPFPPPPNVVPPQRAVAVNTLKEKGNAAMRAKNLPEAVRHYTLAIDLSGGRPLWEPAALASEELAACLSNRSAALLAAGDYVAALADAQAAVELHRPWPKAHYRKGKALAALERYREAREAYQAGQQFDPDNPVCTGKTTNCV